MIRTARNRLQDEDPGAPSNSSSSDGAPVEASPQQLFDGALSNFSGLNCVADLHQTARNLAICLVKMDLRLLCLSTQFCLSEMLWFLSMVRRERHSGDFQVSLTRRSTALR